MSLRAAAALTAVLCLFACHSKEKRAKQESERKQAEEQEIDKRARAVADQIVEKKQEEADQQRQAAAQAAIKADIALRKRVSEHPSEFVDATDIRVTEKGPRRLLSVSLTNKSKYVLSEIQGTVDFHGGAGDEGDVLAQVPVQLTGSIPPGGSMVFSQAEHTVTGAAIQLTKSPARVTFTVTAAQPAAPTGASDGGVASSL